MGWLATIKPDLNRLYTEPPFMTPSGPDAGWFCREHALHTMIVGHMLGHELRLVEGDVLVAAGEQTLTTFGEGGHAWCVGRDDAVFDASIVLRYHGGFPVVGAIEAGAVVSRNYVVVSKAGATEDELLVTTEASSVPTIAYAPRRVSDLRPEHLIEQPFDVVYRPAEGMPSIPEIYGNDIFNQVHLHLFRLAGGRTQSVARLSAKRAFKTIRKQNKQARSEVLKQLSAPRG